MLNVSRPSFYAWRGRLDSAATTRRGGLAVLITRAFEDSRQTYGCRRAAAMLNRQGHPCSVGPVADLMSELGLKAVQPLDATGNTAGRRHHPCLRADRGRMYLAVVPDLAAARMVVGWQMATRMRASLVTDARMRVEPSPFPDPR